MEWTCCVLLRLSKLVVWSPVQDVRNKEIDRMCENYSQTSVAESVVSNKDLVNVDDVENSDKK